MSDTPNSRSFQFRLSTVLAAALATSLFLGLNLAENRHWNEEIGSHTRTAVWIGDRGWPYVFQQNQYVVDRWMGGPFSESKYSDQNPPRFDANRLEHQSWRGRSLAWNALIAFICVAAVVSVFEYILRRRIGRKT